MHRSRPPALPLAGASESGSRLRASSFFHDGWATNRKQNSWVTNVRRSTFFILEEL